MPVPLRSFAPLFLTALALAGCSKRDPAPEGGAPAATGRPGADPTVAASASAATPARMTAEEFCKKTLPWAAEQAGKEMTPEKMAECLGDATGAQKSQPKTYDCLVGCAAEANARDYDACVDKRACVTAPAGGPTPESAPPEAGKRYAMDAIRPLPASCSAPGVVLATTRLQNEDARVDYVNDRHASYTPWHFLRQTVLAYNEFKSVAERPTKPMEVQFIEALYDNDQLAPTAVARCADVDTCNKLMAAYKRVVPSSRPEPLCGLSSPNIIVRDETAFLIDGQGKQDKADVPIAKCVRLAACRFASGADVQGDPALECQKGPAKFKLDCAAKATCADVVRCAE